MELVPMVALLLHPLLASGLVVWIWWQYSWRKKSYELKGESRAQYLERHERMVNCCYGPQALLFSLRSREDPCAAGIQTGISHPIYSVKVFTALWVL